MKQSGRRRLSDAEGERGVKDPGNGYKLICFVALSSCSLLLLRPFVSDTPLIVGRFLETAHRRIGLIDNWEVFDGSFGSRKELNISATPVPPPSLGNVSGYFLRFSTKFLYQVSAGPFSLFSQNLKVRYRGFNYQRHILVFVFLWL